jgi:hypothetical protein
MWDHLKDAATVAPAFTALFALGTFTTALVGVIVALRNQRETTAKATFREFLKLCVQHPELAEGKPPAAQHDEYSWFVAYFLWTAEEILDYSPRKWRKNLAIHIRYHSQYLLTDQRFRKEDLPTYSAPLRRLLRGTLGEPQERDSVVLPKIIPKP